MRSELPGREVLLVAGSAVALLLAIMAQLRLLSDRDRGVRFVLHGLGVIVLFGTLVGQRLLPGSRARVRGRVAPTVVLFGALAVVTHASALVMVGQDSPLILLAVSLWLASLVLAVLAVRALERSRAAPLVVATSDVARASGWDRRDLVTIAILLVLGGAFRLVAVEKFPTGMNGDEGAWGSAAFWILSGGRVYPFDPSFADDMAGSAYLLAPFIAVLGKNLEGIRLATSVWGTLTLVPYYALARSMFGWRVAVLATALLATSFAHIHFSRLAIIVGIPAFFATLALYGIWRGRHGNSTWWVVAGMATGVGMYLNWSARITPAVVGLVMLYDLLARRREWRSWLAGSVLLGVGAALAVTPLLVRFNGRWDRFTGHMVERSIFHHWGQAANRHGTSEPLGVMLGQVKINLLGFLSGGDAGLFLRGWSEPLLNAIIAPFFVLGLALLVWRIRDFRYALVLFWFWASLIAGGVLTLDSPQFHRLQAGVLPAILTAALALDWLAESWSRLGIARLRMAFVPLLAVFVIVLASGAHDAYAYFVRYANAYPWPVETSLGRAVAEFGPSHQVLVAVRPIVDINGGNVRYLAGDGRAAELVNPPLQLPAQPLSKPLVVLLHQSRREWLPLLESLYPEGEVRIIEHPPGIPQFTAVVVEPRMSEPASRAGQGLAFQARPARGGRPVQRAIHPYIAFRGLEALLPPQDRPFTATWRGELTAPVDGLYELELYTDGASLTVDGQEVISATVAPEQPRSYRQTLALRAGPHPVELKYQYVRGHGYLELLWRPPGGERSYVPPAALRPGP